MSLCLKRVRRQYFYFSSLFLFLKKTYRPAQHTVFTGMLHTGFQVEIALHLDRRHGGDGL